MPPWATPVVAAAVEVAGWALVAITLVRWVRARRGVGAFDRYRRFVLRWYPWLGDGRRRYYPPGGASDSLGPRATGGTMPTPNICLSAGHHNRQGGDPEEIRETGLMTPAAAHLCRAAGWPTTVLTPADGAGFSPDSLDTVAARTPATTDLYCEFHSEAGPPGVFVVYPDWGDDVDADVRDTLGPDMARRIARATGLGVRAGGVLSEQRTGVGLAGSRLGIFRVTESLRQRTSRMILELGSHTDAGDLALIRGADFYAKAAGAWLEAVAAFYGVEVAARVVPHEGDAISKALVAWYASLSPATLKGDESPAAHYEAEIDFSSIFPAVQGWQRGIVGEYVAAWYDRDGTIRPVHRRALANLEANGHVRVMF